MSLQICQFKFVFKFKIKFNSAGKEKPVVYVVFFLVDDFIYRADLIIKLIEIREISIATFANDNPLSGSIS